MRVAAYARYSTELQSSTSIDDQLRNCRAYAQRQGWPEPVTYTDAAISGARLDRPGYQRLLADAGRFDVILVDDLSRLSRDSVETQQAIKRLTFAGLRVIGVSDGVDTGRKGHKLEVGMRGMMSELYLADLADKTHRGLTGRALAGASAGGLPYGYRVTERGQRAVDEAQARVVQRIYADYLAGRSPRAIAAALNAERVPSARSATWGATAIHGDQRRGIGILANPIYCGRQVWNRSQWVKHPDSGRRVRRERPESEWIITEHPELVIVPAAQWEAVQAQLRRNGSPHAGKSKGGPGRRPQHLLSGLLRCQHCGGPMVVISQYLYGCATSKQRGDSVCPGVTVSRSRAEDALLSGVRAELASEGAFRRFQSAVAAALKRRAPDENAAAAKLARAEKELANLMAAIRAGVITASTRAEVLRAEKDVAAARADLEALRKVQPTTMLPRLRETWSAMAATLSDRARDRPATRAALRELIGSAVARNENGATWLEVAPSSIELVAGARFGLYLREPLVIPLESGAHPSRKRSR